MRSRIIILDACVKELKKFPSELQKDLLTITEQLNRGVVMAMPLSRPMPSIGKGVHEIRLKDKSGQYRVIYWLRNSKGEIVYLHAFMKKTQKTPKKNLNLVKRRLGSIT